MISSVVSDAFAKLATAIIKFAMNNPDKTDIDYTQFLHRSMLPKANEIKVAMQGSISKEQTSKMSICLNQTTFISVFLSLMRPFL